MREAFLTGLNVLLAERLNLLRGRVGLVTHPAALAVNGQWSADAFHQHPDIDLRLLMGPEHGVLGHAGAGEPVASRPHPTWGLPMYSLYGEQRKPTAEILDAVDVIVVDLQDLGVRCYTYVSTLSLVMEAAAERGKRVVVADRPVPLPNTVDGPDLDPVFDSFVAGIPAPMVYGMTPGEAARFLRNTRGEPLDLQVVPMRNYVRRAARPTGAPPWVPPSPGIRSWETAQGYPATVFCEALPALDFGKGTALAFQVVGAPWLHAEAVCDVFSSQAPAGVSLFPHGYFPGVDTEGGVPWPAVRLVVNDPDAYAPIRTAVTLLSAIQDVHGTASVWAEPVARKDFFDQLFGGAQVGRELRAKSPVDRICAAWREDRDRFMTQRDPCLLYPPAEETVEP